MANRLGTGSLSSVARDARKKSTLGVRNKGVARAVRQLKRAEASERNAHTPIERTKRFRLSEVETLPHFGDTFPCNAT